MASRARPLRPTPTEKVLDYDDGCPYSCMAAGRKEEELQKALQDRVLACFTDPESDIESLVKQDWQSVKTAFFDIWLEASQSAPQLHRWAAQEAARLGYEDLLKYDMS